MYTKNKYPDSLKNLDPAVREKAIEIINALLKEWMKEEKAIPIGIYRAKESVLTTADSGSNAKKSWKKSTHEVEEVGIYQETYLVQKEDGKRKVRKKQAVRASSIHDTKQEAVHHARLLSERYNAKVRIIE